MRRGGRSALGASIWAERVHTKLAYPVNLYCAYMSNPSPDVYKAWKQTLLHEIAFPTPIVLLCLVDMATPHLLLARI